MALRRLAVGYRLTRRGLFEETPPGLEPRFGVTVVENFASLCWHDSYHAGQLAVLRELALSCQRE